MLHFCTVLALFPAVWGAVTLQYSADSQLPPVAHTGSAWSFSLLTNTFVATASETLTLSASNLPSFVSFDADSATFTGTPTAADAGSYNVSVTASSGSASKSTFFTLLAVSETAIPTLENSLVSQLRNETAVLDGATLTSDTALMIPPQWSFSLGFYPIYNDDSRKVYYSAQEAGTTSLPSWLKFDNTTVTFTGTAPNSTGSFSIRVGASYYYGHVDEYQLLNITNGYHTFEQLSDFAPVNATRLSTVAYTLPLGGLRIDNADAEVTNITSVTLDLSNASYLAWSADTLTLSGEVPNSTTVPQNISLPMVLTDAYNSTLNSTLELRLYADLWTQTALPALNVTPHEAFLYDLKPYVTSLQETQFNVSGLPSWMSFDATNLTLSGEYMGDSRKRDAMWSAPVYERTREVPDQLWSDKRSSRDHPEPWLRGVPAPGPALFADNSLFAERSLAESQSGPGVPRRFASRAHGAQLKRGGLVNREHSVLRRAETADHPISKRALSEPPVLARAFGDSSLAPPANGDHPISPRAPTATLTRRDADISITAIDSTLNIESHATLTFVILPAASSPSASATASATTSPTAASHHSSSRALGLGLGLGLGLPALLALLALLLCCVRRRKRTAVASPDAATLAGSHYSPQTPATFATFTTAVNMDEKAGPDKFEAVPLPNDAAEVPGYEDGSHLATRGGTGAAAGATDLTSAPRSTSLNSFLNILGLRRGQASLNRQSTRPRVLRPLGSPAIVSPPMASPEELYGLGFSDDTPRAPQGAFPSSESTPSQFESTPSQFESNHSNLSAQGPSQTESNSTFKSGESSSLFYSERSGNNNSSSLPVINEHADDAFSSGSSSGTHSNHRIRAIFNSRVASPPRRRSDFLPLHRGVLSPAHSQDGFSEDTE